MGGIQMSMREPIKLSSTFLVFFPNHLFLPEYGWVSYCMEWEEYGQKFELGREPIFEKCVLTSFARKIPKNVCHSDMNPCFFIFLTILLHVGAFGSTSSFSCVFFIPHFCLLASFSHGWEVVFVMLGIGLSSSCFWSCWCIFHSCFCSFMCFYHGCEVFLLTSSGWDLCWEFWCRFHMPTVGSFVV